MCKLLTCAEDEYESDFVRDKRKRNNQFKGDCADATLGLMNLMIEMSDLFGFISDFQRLFFVNDVNIEMNVHESFCKMWKLFCFRT